MNVKQLISEFKDFEIIWKRYIELYDYEIAYKFGYKCLFNRLQKTKLKEQNNNERTMFIFISKCSEDLVYNEKTKTCDWSFVKPYYHVYGQNGELHGDITNSEEMSNCEISFALYGKIQEWLNYEIFDTTLQEYSKLDIICHILYEIVWSLPLIKNRILNSLYVSICKVLTKHYYKINGD